MDHGRPSPQEPTDAGHGHSHSHGGCGGSRVQVALSSSSADIKFVNPPDGFDLNGTVDDAEQIRRQSRTKKALSIAVVFCFLFMVLELAGGVIANSLALINDAVHMGTDVFNLSISLFAAVASTWRVPLDEGGRPIPGRPSSKLSFGWRRMEVLGAMASVFTTWALIVWIVVEAITRTVTIVKCNTYDYAEGDPRCEAVDAQIMVILGAIGFASNVICACILMWGGHGHSHGGLYDTCDGSGHGHSHDSSAHGHSHSPATSGGNSMRTVSSGNIEDTPNEHSPLNDSIGCDDGHGHSHQGDSLTADHPEDDHSDIPSADHKRNMNIRGAMIHAIGDCLQSLGVMIAAAIIWAFNKGFYGDGNDARSLFNLADPGCSVVFAIITIFTTKGLARDIFYILMEGHPPQIDIAALKESILHVDGVETISEIHLYSLNPNDIILTVRIVARVETVEVSTAIRSKIRRLVNKQGVDHVTIEVHPSANTSRSLH